MNRIYDQLVTGRELSTPIYRSLHEVPSRAARHRAPVAEPTDSSSTTASTAREAHGAQRAIALVATWPLGTVTG